MNSIDQLSNSTSDFLKGKSKPTILFEFTYINLAAMMVAVILSVVISKVILNAISK